MTDKMRKAMKEAVKYLSSLSKEELHNLLKEHENGDIALALKELNYFRAEEMKLS